MKKLLAQQPLLLAGMLLLLSTGCTKHTNNLPSPASLCNIQSIVFPALIPTIMPKDTMTFAYDADGRPLYMHRNQTGTDQVNFVFRYDQQHRLTDVIGTGTSVTNPLSYDTWHKLYYKNGRIALDSLFDFGMIKGNRPVPNDSEFLLRDIATFEFDGEGRMSRSIDNFFSLVLDQTYSYDENGNMYKIVTLSYYLYNPSNKSTTTTYYSGYDDKINPNSTNPIWQFFNRDYSRNNHFHADAYDRAGFPTAISNKDTLGTKPAPLPFAFPYFWLNAEETYTPYHLTINYTCELPTMANNGHGY